MKALWETTEQILVLVGLGLVAIQISFMLKFYVLAGILASVLILAGAVVLLHYYERKHR